MTTLINAARVKSFCKSTVVLQEISEHLGEAFARIRCSVLGNMFAILAFGCLLLRIDCLLHAGDEIIKVDMLSFVQCDNV